MFRFVTSLEQFQPRIPKPLFGAFLRPHFMNCPCYPWFCPFCSPWKVNITYTKTVNNKGSLDTNLKGACNINIVEGPSINHGLRVRGNQGFCDNSTKALVLKSVTIGLGYVKNHQKMRDVIYGRPLSSNERISVFTWMFSSKPLKAGWTNCILHIWKAN